MSLDYYLFCRKRYENIIRNLEEIVYENDLFFDETEKLEIDISEQYFRNNLKYFITLKDICERKIHKLCEHNSRKESKN